MCPSQICPRPFPRKSGKCSEYFTDLTIDDGEEDAHHQPSSADEVNYSKLLSECAKAEGLPQKTVGELPLKCQTCLVS